MDPDSPVTNAQLEKALEGLKDALTETMRDLQTEILRAFADFNPANNIRIRKLESDANNLDTATTIRLGSLEERVTDLTMRLLKLEGEKPAAQT